MTDDEGLPSGCRPIRRLAGGRESPWPGLLVSAVDGTSGILVDAALFERDWPGWRADIDGHLMRPLDVIRRRDGHDVLFPVCVERVADLLERRRGSGSAVGAGEAVTLGVSLIRGLQESAAADAAEPARGTWWLTDSGRPVLAVGASEESASETTIALLEQIAETVPALAEAVHQSTDAIHRGSLHREEARLERAFFAAETPRPVGTTVFGSRSARSVAAYRDEAALPDAGPPRGHWAAALARHLDAEWADVISRTTTAVWRGVRTRRRSARRAPWIAAAGAAVIVLAGGLLWPSGGDEPATADAEAVRVAPNAGSPTPETPTPSAPAPSAPSPTAEGAAETVDSIDAVTVTDRLLAERVRCQADATCLSAVQEFPDRALLPGAIDLEGSERTLTLLDEFGGVTVLRADPMTTSTPSQLVVIVRSGDRWLLRDVHDVAQQ